MNYKIWLTIPQNLWFTIPCLQNFQVFGKIFLTLRLQPILWVYNAHGIKQGTMREVVVQLIDQLGSCPTNISKLTLEQIPNNPKTKSQVNIQSLWENIGFYNSTCNWVFQLQQTLATHGIYMALSANGQVAKIATDTLCCIYGATHMQLTCNFFATNFHIKFSHTFQHDFSSICQWMTYVNTFCNLFTTILQLVWQI